MIIGPHTRTHIHTYSCGMQIQAVHLIFCLHLLSAIFCAIIIPSTRLQSAQSAVCPSYTVELVRSPGRWQQDCVTIAIDTRSTIAIFVSHLLLCRSGGSASASARSGIKLALAAVNVPVPTSTRQRRLHKVS